MRISDSERARIAEKLRERADDPWMELGDLCGDIGCDVRRGEEASVFRRLADLIDPDNIPSNQDESAHGLSGRCDRDALLDLSARMGKICDEWGHEACGYFGVASGDCDRCDAYEDPGRCILVAVKDAYDRIRKAVDAYEARPDVPAAVDEGQSATDARMDDSEAADGARTPSIEVLRWVNGRGGLDAVRESVEQSECRKKLLDCFAMRLGFESLEDAGDIFKELEKRLMPEGMEWLLEVWPRWSNGEYCKFGDWWKSDKYGESEPRQFRKLSVYTPEQLDEWGQGDGESFGYEWDFVRPSDSKYRPNKVEPPAPKVLDADGVEIKRGDTVWPTENPKDGYVLGGEVLTMARADGGRIRVDFLDESGNISTYYASELTHRAPVLAADGEPLEVGQTVWNIDNGMEFTVSRLPKPGEYQAVEVRYRNGSSTSFDPDQLTHQRPVLDAAGVPIKKGDTVWHIKTGREYVVVEPSYGETVVVRLAGHDDADGEQYAPGQLTHTEPDSWERLEEDANHLAEAETNGRGSYNAANDYCNAHGLKDGSVWVLMARDLVRRAKALAGVSE